MGKCGERVFKKNSLKPNTASHNNAFWSTDTDGFLGHSPSGGSLYYRGPTLQKIKALQVFGGTPLYIYTCNVYINLFLKYKYFSLYVSSSFLLFIHSFLQQIAISYLYDLGVALTLQVSQ